MTSQTNTQRRLRVSLFPLAVLEFIDLKTSENFEWYSRTLTQGKTLDKTGKYIKV